MLLPCTFCYVFVSEDVCTIHHFRSVFSMMLMAVEQHPLARCRDDCVCVCVCVFRCESKYVTVSVQHVSSPWQIEEKFLTLICNKQKQKTGGFIVQQNLQSHLPLPPSSTTASYMAVWDGEPVYAALTACQATP